ncbi:MAG: lycopene beta-cyclase CrtY [Pseudomonadota bacterium]
MERLIIAGGGLSGVLTAMAVKTARPEAHLTLIEQGETLGGNHTWSFYETDLDARGTALITPMITYAWDGYETRFPDLSRSFSTGYRTIKSRQLHEVAMAALGPAVRLNTPIEAVDDRGVTLTGGERLSADTVIDARGARELKGTVLRWQKFLGREVKLDAPHGLTQPTIMDATVSQIDGYRFVYLLPFTEDTLLIEDTYYSEGAEIDRQALHKRIDDYAASRGWRIVADNEQERGALPLLLSGDFAKMWQHASPPGSGVPLGLRAGLFHPVTGYSLPASVRVAIAIGDLSGPLTTERVRAAVKALAQEHFRSSSFDRLLNRFLFLAGRPENRHRVLARFHTMPQGLIERFYAGRLPPLERIRILFGKPPIPIHQAVMALPERAAHVLR